MDWFNKKKFLEKKVQGKEKKRKKKVCVFIHIFVVNRMTLSSSLPFSVNLL